MNHVIVTTAVKLESALRPDLNKTIESKLSGADYELKEVIDPTVLGGLRLQINSSVYDATVMGKLTALQSVSR